MDIIQYFESVREAFANDDTDRVEEIMKEHGDESVVMKDVEKLVAYVFGSMAGFQVALEEKGQVHFDILVNALESAKLLSEEDIGRIRDLDSQLNEALEGEGKEQENGE